MLVIRKLSHVLILVSAIIVLWWQRRALSNFYRIFPVLISHFHFSLILHSHFSLMHSVLYDDQHLSMKETPEINNSADDTVSQASCRREACELERVHAVYV